MDGAGGTKLRPAEGGESNEHDATGGEAATRQADGGVERGIKRDGSDNGRKDDDDRQEAAEA